MDTVKSGDRERLNEASGRVLQGDALRVLKTLPDASVHCCVTSPPYYGLRQYQSVPDTIWGGAADCDHVWSGRFCDRCGAWRGQLGLESTPDQYVAHLVEVFREVRRVLRADGTLWLNLGDSYAGSGGAHADHHKNPGLSKSAARDGVPHRGECGEPSRYLPPSGLKPKDLCMIPARAAIALQADGWWLRADIVWEKPNPMPESVEDRPTRSHEYIFLLAKSARYFYDAEAIRETAVKEGQLVRASGETSKTAASPDRVNDRRTALGLAQHDRLVTGRNNRSVWTIATRPFVGAHFATFPPELPERCIRAATSEHGVCVSCGAPYRRIVGKTTAPQSDRPQTQRAIEIATVANLSTVHIEAIRSAGLTDVGRARATQRGTGQNTEQVQQLAAEAKAALGGYYKEFLLIGNRTIGWQPSCACANPLPVPATVLDPFLGSGTTALVALRLGRSAIGIEISPTYAEMAQQRISADAPLLNSIYVEAV